MRDSVPSARYSSVCNVLRLWSISLIPTYRVYRLYDIVLISFMLLKVFSAVVGMLMSIIKIPVNFLKCLEMQIYYHHSSITLTELYAKS